MYSYLYGEVVSINKKTITFECNNVGYAIYVTNPNEYSLQKKIHLYIYSQYSLTSKNSFIDDMYGFKTYQAKELFLSLMRCQGIGAKTSLQICTNNNDLIRQLIVDKNVEELSKCKGVSSKSAKVIIDTLYDFYIAKTNIDNSNSKQITQLFSALNSLGYKDQDIQYAISKLTVKKNPTEEQLSDLITQAIKIIIKKDTNGIESN